MSTVRLPFLPIIAVIALFTVLPVSAWASTATFAVIPFDYEVPNIGRGMAEILSTEIAVGHLKAVGSNRLKSECETLDIEYSDLARNVTQDQATLLAETADYIVIGEIVAFKISDKDQPVDLGDELNDLGRLVGQGSVSCHVALDVRIIDTKDGSTAASWLLEGIESRNGLRMNSLSYGWSGSVDMLSDEFRETMIGRATYKALGKVLYNLYELFPVEGEVLAVSGDAVVVNLDDTNGVEIGDELTIVRRQLIKNSDGIVAWRNDQPVGRVEVIEFQPGRCLCLVLDGLGGIAEDDIAIPVVARYTLPQYADVDY